MLNIISSEILLGVSWGRDVYVSPTAVSSGACPLLAQNMCSVIIFLMNGFIYSLTCDRPIVQCGCACMLSCCSHVWLFVTPWTIAFQAPLSVVSRQEYWSGLPCPSPGDLTNPGIKHVSLTSPALAGWFFSTSATWEALVFGDGESMSRSVTCNSLWPHGLMPTKPGKNTGVGCHFLLVLGTGM